MDNTPHTAPTAAAKTITAYPMSRYHSSSPARTCRGEAVQVPSASIRATGRQRFENRSYFWIMLANGDAFGVKVTELPKPIARLFKRWEKRGHNYQTALEWMDCTTDEIVALRAGTL